MVLKPSPFKKTCSNILFNISHYKRTKLRPSFQALNHPFCTNSQLLDASYAHWIRRAARNIPSKIFNDVVECEKKSGRSEKRHFKGFKVSGPLASATLVSGHTGDPYHGHSVDDGLSQRRNNFINNHGSIIEMISQSLGNNDLVSISEQVLSCSDKQAIVDSNILHEIFDMVNRQTPEKRLEERLQGLEPALFQTKNNTIPNTPYYNYIRDKIPYLYKICKHYKNLMQNDKKFQEEYIWLCYHMDDLDDLQNMISSYLSNKQYCSQSLGYLLSAFILNYEVEFSKNLFSNIISMGRPLNACLLDILVSQFVKADSLFENLIFAFKKWIESPNCDPPSQNSLSLLTKEFAKYGSNDERSYLHRVVENSEFSNHFLIKLAELEVGILHSSNSGQKSIDQIDIARFNDIELYLKDSNNEEDLRVFYYICLEIFTKRLNMTMIQYVFYKMKSNGIKPTQEFFELVCNYYVSEGKLFALIQFLKASSSSAHFDEIFVRSLFNCAITGYPHHALNIKEQFDIWVSENESLSDLMKDSLIRGFRISKIESQLTPFALHRDLLKPKKYDSPTWEKLFWKHDKSGKVKKCSNQINFRVNKGFKDIMRKGVKPDIKVFEKTFRRSNPEHRKTIIHYLKLTRLFKIIEPQLYIYDMQLKQMKDKVNYFSEIIETSYLTPNQILMISRIFMNNSLHNKAIEFLNKLKEEELSDRGKMVKLNYLLRNLLLTDNYEKMNHVIEQFPIDETILSPYILKQCQFIEQLLLKKLRVSRNSSNLHFDELLNILKSLRGFIGDVELRLVQDDIEIKQKLKEVFEFLDDWKLHCYSIRKY